MIPFEWWGTDVPYPDALERQRRRRDEVVEGTGDEVLGLLEHRDVVTTGRRPAPGLDRERLAARGVPVVPSERGGLATWHGPGQLVGYLICDVQSRGLGARHTVHALEAGLIAWLAQVGVEGERDCGRPGVWVGPNKVAAIGLHFRRGVSMHGFALNLRVAQDAWDGLVPCGIAAAPASLDRLIPQAPSPEEAHEHVAHEVLAALARAGS